MPKKAILKRMKLFRAAFILVLVFLATGCEAADNSLLERAKNLYSVQDYNNALTLFEKVLQADPENGEAWDYAGWCHHYLGNWKQANSGFMEAEKFLPGTLAKWVKVGRGETYLSAGLSYSAIEAFGQAIALAPDDDELVARSMKGIVFANATLGDQPKTEEAMEKLKGKYPDTAAEIESDTSVLLEKNKRPEPPAAPVSEKPAAPLPGEPDIADEDLELNDKGDRMQMAIQHAAASGDQLPATPPQAQDNSQPAAAPEVAANPQSVTIWDLPVGDDMQSVMAWLSERGIAVQKNEEATKLGSLFYTASLPSGFAMYETLCTLEEFQGKLLSVAVSATWRERKNIISLKEDLFKEISGQLSKKYGDSVSFSDNGIAAEMCWLSGETHFIALTATASLDGQVVLNISLSDLPALNAFWEYAARFNEQQGQ